MTFFIVTIIAAVVLMILAVVFAGVWVYKDAKQRGLPAGMWTLLVILGGNFIGLILYLMIGRKQAAGVCGSCGVQVGVQSTFCPSCGEKLTIRSRVVPTSKKLLIASVVCIVLAFASAGVSIISIFTADGFTLNNQYSFYSYSSGGYAKKISQKSSGDTWTISFEEVSDGYTLQNKYNAKIKPSSLAVELECNGSVQLFITQDTTSINETIGSGSFIFDMSDFEVGKINMRIVNIDASKLSGKLTVETEK